ncbi:MAG: hypothetical protein WDW38_006365 [Sanguina aurantia]
MSAKGCFSYKNDTIYMTDVDGNPVSVPDAVTLRDSAGANVAAYNNEFLITWVDSYILSVAGVDNVWMTNQKQQAFKTAAGITHFTI